MVLKVLKKLHLRLQKIFRVTVEIYEGFDIDEVLQNVKNSVDAIYSLPQGAENLLFSNKQAEEWVEWEIWLDSIH